MTVIRKMAPINLIVHYPKTEEGRLELAQRVAEVHANAVHQHIKRLPCPTRQKQALLDAVIEDARKKVSLACSAEADITRTICDCPDR